jgi:hypothetical protein
VFVSEIQHRYLRVSERERACMCTIDTAYLLVRESVYVCVYVCEMKILLNAYKLVRERERTCVRECERKSMCETDTAFVCETRRV